MIIDVGIQNEAFLLYNDITRHYLPMYSIIEHIFLICSLRSLDRPVVGLRRITIFPPPVGPDFGTVQKGPIASSAWTWSAIRNTALRHWKHSLTFQFSEFHPNHFIPHKDHHQLLLEPRERCSLDLFDALNPAVAPACLCDHWLWLHHWKHSPTSRFLKFCPNNFIAHKDYHQLLSRFVRLLPWPIRRAESSRGPHLSIVYLDGKWINVWCIQVLGPNTSNLLFFTADRLESLVINVCRNRPQESAPFEELRWSMPAGISNPRQSPKNLGGYLKIIVGRNCIEDDRTRLEYCPMKDMVADGLTKALGLERHRKLAKMMGMDVWQKSEDDAATKEDGMEEEEE